MRKTIRVSLLVIALAYSVRAGEIPNMIAAPPPPTSATGEIQYPVAAATIALELLQGLVSLA